MALSEGELEFEAFREFEDASLTSGSATLSTTTQKMVSACAGAILTSLLVTPFDVVKTRMQSTPAKRSHDGTVKGCCREVFWTLEPGARGNAMATTPHCETSAAGSRGAGCISSSKTGTIGDIGRINGTWDGVKKIVRYEGVRGLWRGLSPTLIMSVPSTVIYYIGYEHLRDHIITRIPPEKRFYAPLLAGGIARTIAATAISPIELVRTRMQSGRMGRSVRGVLAGVQGMVRINGWTSLWRGLAPTLWRDVPFSAIYWIGYESFKPHFSPPAHHPHSTTAEFQAAFLAGATSGTIAAVCTIPFDVAKTHQQIETASSHPHKALSSQGMMSVMRKIVRQEGWQGLFRGLSPRVAKVAPACAVMISSYEVGKKFFEGVNGERR